MSNDVIVGPKSIINPSRAAGAPPRGPRSALAAGILAMLTLTPIGAHADGAGYAIVLDGIGGYLGCDLPGVLRGCNEITLAAWILRVGPGGDLISPEPRGQAAAGLGFHLGLSAGKIFLAKGTGSGSYVFLIGSTAVPVGEWHHVAATFDGLTMRVYLDGVLDGSLADSGPVQWNDLPPVYPPDQTNWPSPAQLYVGADKHNQPGPGPTIPDFAFYEGTIDEAQIWDRALPLGEIETYRWLNLLGTEPGLVGYWKFDEGIGTITADASGPNGDLTLYPGATWTPSGAPVEVTAVGPGEALRDSRLAAFPNPTAGDATILLETRSQASGRVAVFDQSGRRIANLWSGTAAPGGRLFLRWNGRDSEGRAAASGVYLVRFQSANTHVVTRLMVLH